MTATPPMPNLSRVQAAHALFRGSAEITKHSRQVALGLEVLAAVIAAYGVLNGTTLWGGWASLVMLLLVAGGTALRVWSRGTQAFSERCRRVSVRGFAEGQEIGAALLSGLVSDAPVFAVARSRMLPAGTLEDYYEPTKPAGFRRLQELYAHSSFYSWRLLGSAGALFLVTGTAIAIIGAVAIYGLVVEPSPSATTAERVLDVVCSLVFVTLSARAVDAGIAALVGGRESRRVADELIATAASDRIAELTSLYDMNRNSGPLVPTLLYRVSRDSLQKEWHSRRLALDELG